jgi:hypothetical protein
MNIPSSGKISVMVTRHKNHTVKSKSIQRHNGNSNRKTKLRRIPNRHPTPFPELP